MLNSTPLSIYEISEAGEKLASTQSLTTREVPMGVVTNLMKLHEMATPGAIIGFAKSMSDAGVMEDVITKVVEPHARYAETRGETLDVAHNPAHLMQAFYASSFLQNDEASQCLVYSVGGKVAGFAHVGRFAPQVPSLTCSISNLLLSPEVSSDVRRQIVRSVAAKAKATYGEASLITPSRWGGSYVKHGFSVEHVSPEGSAGMESGMVRCRLP